MPVLKISLHAALEKSPAVQIHHFTKGSSTGENKIKAGWQGSKVVVETQGIQPKQASQITVKVNYNMQRLK